MLVTYILVMPTLLQLVPTYSVCSNELHPSLDAFICEYHHYEDIGLGTTQD